MTSMFAELRAERRAERVAEAEVQQTIADRRAERRRADQTHALQLQASARAEEDARRRVEQAQRDARRQALRDTRRIRRAALWARLPELGNAALWATVIVLPIALAWTAQAVFAADVLHIPSPLNHGFPASIETGAWVCVFEARRRTRAGLPTGSLTGWTWALASIAAAINAAHGLQDGGPAAGFALGTLSLLGVILHTVRQGLDSAAVAGRRPGLSLWRRVRYPRLSLAAASIRAARELDQDTAWFLAWVDRFGVGPESSRRDRKLGRLITRREDGEDKKAADSGELTIVAGRITRAFAAEVREILDVREQFPRYTLPGHILPLSITANPHSGSPDVPNFGTSEVRKSAPAESPAEPQLSARAAQLWPAVRKALAGGELTSTGVGKIRAYVRDELGESIGVPTAQELRDAAAGDQDLPTSLQAVS